MNTTNRPLAAKIAILAVLVAVPAAACTDYVAATTTTTAAHLDAEAAVMQLVDTRCEREARCNILAVRPIRTGTTARSNTAAGSPTLAWSSARTASTACCSTGA